MDRAYQCARSRERHLLQQPDERTQEGRRPGRSQDAGEARAGTRRIVYRAGAHREERARLASSIKPRRSKRRAPNTMWAFSHMVFVFCAIKIATTQGTNDAGNLKMKEQLEEIRRRAIAELTADADEA